MNMDETERHNLIPKRFEIGKHYTQAENMLPFFLCPESALISEQNHTSHF